MILYFYIWLKSFQTPCLACLVAWFRVVVGWFGVVQFITSGQRLVGILIVNFPLSLRMAVSLRMVSVSLRLSPHPHSVELNGHAKTPIKASKASKARVPNIFKGVYIICLSLNYVQDPSFTSFTSFLKGLVGCSGAVQFFAIGSG